MAFKTQDSLFEWMFVPFGLSNAHLTFVGLMTHVLQPFMGKFLMAYFVDIKSMFDYIHHLRQLFYTLREAKLFCNKCVFLQP